LHGHLRPAGIVGELRRMAGAGADGTDPRGMTRMLGLRVTLRDGMSIPAAGDPALPLRDDGAFRFDGLPPGPCRLHLQYAFTYDGSAAITGGEPIADVQLAEGETRELDVDLARMMPGDLEGVAWNGDRPLAGGRLMVGCDPTGRGKVDAFLGVTTDAEGRFRLHGRPGLYSFAWATGSGTQLRTGDVAVVTSGATTPVNLRFTSGSVRLRLLDTEGRPLSGVQVFAIDGGVRTETLLRATDDDGRGELVLASGPQSLWVLPKRLLAEDALRAANEQHRGDARWFASQLIRAGDVQVRAGEAADCELRLPPEWGR
jgi:hypothetical protein